MLARTELGLQLAESVAHWDVDAPEVHFGHGYRSSLIVGGEVKMTAPWRPSSDPGFRDAHAWLRPGVSTLDVFGEGFVLLCFAPHERIAGVERAFEQRGVPLQVVLSSDERVAELYRHPYVLVRPDDHVAWRGQQPPADPLRTYGTQRATQVGLLAVGVPGLVHHLRLLEPVDLRAGQRFRHRRATVTNRRRFVAEPPRVTLSGTPNVRTEQN